MYFFGMFSTADVENQPWDLYRWELCVKMWRTEILGDIFRSSEPPRRRQFQFWRFIELFASMSNQNRHFKNLKNFQKISYRQTPKQKKSTNCFQQRAKKKSKRNFIIELIRIERSPIDVPPTERSPYYDFILIKKNFDKDWK